jgi:hypothetical protein
VSRELKSRVCGGCRCIAKSSGPDEEMTEGDGDGDGEGTRGNAGASALETRARIRKLVLAGSIDDAIAAVRDEFPSLWQQSDAGVAFHLHGQKFLELLAAQQAVQAVQYARTHLAPYRRSDDPARTQMLEVCVIIELDVGTLTSEYEEGSLAFVSGWMVTGVAGDAGVRRCGDSACGGASDGTGPSTRGGGRG